MKHLPATKRCTAVCVSNASAEADTHGASEWTIGLSVKNLPVALVCGLKVCAFPCRATAVFINPTTFLCTFHRIMALTTHLQLPPPLPRQNTMTFYAARSDSSDMQVTSCSKKKRHTSTDLTVTVNMKSQPMRPPPARQKKHQSIHTSVYRRFN